MGLVVADAPPECSFDRPGSVGTALRLKHVEGFLRAWVGEQPERAEHVQSAEDRVVPVRRVPQAQPLRVGDVTGSFRTEQAMAE
jgi:hypothetical protein